MNDDSRFAGVYTKVGSREITQSDFDLVFAGMEREKAALETSEQAPDPAE